MKNVTQGKGLEAGKKGHLKTRLVQHWLLPTIVGTLLLAAPPAEAARLESWRFEPNQNRLSFTTNGGVQPTAQLLANPTRLVIDLPGTTLGGRPEVERLGGVIREIRIGQFNSETSRIVVELAEGYTLNPQEVKIQGASPNQWSVQLPTPQRKGENPPVGSSASGTDSTLTAGATEATTLLQEIQVQEEGFILHTSGEKPQIDLKHNRNRTAVSIDLEGVTIAPELDRRNVQIDRLGVDRLQVLQASSSPPVTRVVLNLTDPDRQWQAKVSDRGEVMVWPEGKEPPAVSAATRSGLATIQSIELATNGSEVVVKADRPLNYSTEWDRRTLAYRLTIFSSELADSVKQLRPQRGSSVLWVRASQEDPETVVVLVQPAAGVQITGVGQTNSEQLSVQLRGTEVATVSPDIGLISVPKPRDAGSVTPPATDNPPEIPPIPNGRLTIAIDAGHGGSDPGAIGIGGMREKEIVLEISQQVSEILEQNGVNAIMTRQDDRTIDLAPRTQLANRVNADLFVSIHANAVAGARPEVNGVETFYYQSGRTLAESIQNSILQSFEMRNRGVKRARFYVLRHTNMPAVLVEVGFVTGIEDARVLADPAQRSRMAEAIARGILQYLQGRP